MQVTFSELRLIVLYLDMGRIRMGHSLCSNRVGSACLFSRSSLTYLCLDLSVLFSLTCTISTMVKSGRCLSHSSSVVYWVALSIIFGKRNCIGRHSSFSGHSSQLSGRGKISKNVATRGPEARLYLVLFAAVTFPASLFIYAWCTFPNVHWISLCIAITVRCLLIINWTNV